MKTHRTEYEELRRLILEVDRRLRALAITGGGGGGSGITQLTADVTAGPGSGSQAATLAASGVAADTYGDATHVPQIIVDAKGRITSASEVPITGGGGGGVISASGFYLDDGSQKFAPVFPATPPVDGDFAWINQGGASVDTTNGGIYLSGPANASTSWRIRKKAVTAPYTLTVGFIPDLPRLTAERCAVLWRQSSDGKLITVELSFNGAPGTPTVEVDKWTSVSAFSGTYVSFGNYTPFSALHWYRLVDDNTNRKIYISFDGAHWRLIHSVGRTDFLTADEVGFAVDPNNASEFAAMTVISWLET